MRSLILIGLCLTGCTTNPPCLNITVKVCPTQRDRYDQTKKRNKTDAVRIEARFDALTFEDSQTLSQGAFFVAQHHPAKWSLSVTAEVLAESSLMIR